jgi:hypothetical protein
MLTTGRSCPLPPPIFAGTARRIAPRGKTAANHPTRQPNTVPGRCKKAAVANHRGLETLRSKAGTRLLVVVLAVRRRVRRTT